MIDYQPPQVWIRTFWGFSPADDGFIGFTHPGTRRKFLELSRPGDLVLIYGGNSPETASHERSQALGFLEISSVSGAAKDFQSTLGQHRKAERGWSDRWNHAVRATRAWRISTPVNVNHLFPESLDPKDGRLRGTRGTLLAPRDSERAMGLPVQQVAVFGLPWIGAEDAPDLTLAKKLLSRSGPAPAFGEFATTRDDKGSYLYLMVFFGPITELVPPAEFLKGRILIKAGRTNDLERRLEELNAGFPSMARIGWTMLEKSEYAGESASVHDAEQALHHDLARRGTALGNEFYLIDQLSAQTGFAMAAQSYRSYFPAR